MVMKKWHPYAETYPLIEGEEFDKMVASVKKTKGNKDKPCLYRVRAGQDEGLDGRNRERACRAARVKCFWKKVTVSDEDVEEFIDRHNDVRRHMTPDQRAERVVKLREQGRSTREIAEKVGASQTTVLNDLKAADRSGEQNCSPDGSKPPGKPQPPEKIVGQDGKQYPARQEDVGDAHEGPILCKRCQRVGVVADCPGCKEARDKDAKRDRQKGKRQGPQRNGQVKFDSGPFKQHFGAVGRQIDSLARHYGAKGDKRIEALHKQLVEFKSAFTQVQHDLANPPAARAAK